MYKVIDVKTAAHNTHYLAKFIERSIIFLLIFTPLAFGAVQRWSIAVMEITILVVFGAWLIKLILNKKPNVVTSPVLYFSAGLILLYLLQLTPLPLSLIGAVSPTTATLYAQFADQDVALHPLSIFPDATKEELYKFIVYNLAFFIIINHYRSREQIKQVFHVIVGMGCFLSVFALVQKITWNGNLYWIYPVTISSNIDYIWGPYINHNHFAGYLELAIPLAFALLLYKISKVHLHSNPFSLNKILDATSKKKSYNLVVLSLAVLLMSGALFASLSRGGIMSFSIAILVFGLITSTRRSIKKKRWIIGLVIFSIFSTMVIIGGNKIESRFEEISEEGKIKRVDIWMDSVELIADFPVLGTGLGTFNKIYPKYQSKNQNLFFEHAENDYIETLADSGVIGLLIVIGLLFAFFLTAFKAWKRRHDKYVVLMVASGISSCMAIAIHSLTDFNLRIPANALTLTVIAALTHSMLFHLNSSKTPHKLRAGNEEKDLHGNISESETRIGLDRKLRHFALIHNERCG